MASLMQLLFDTMPLVGAWKAAQLDDESDIATLTTLQDHLAYIPASERTLLSNTNAGLSDAEKKLHRHEQPIWSFDATANVFSVQKLSVRGEQENYQDCLVLENLEFGADFGNGFENAIEVDLPFRGKRKLALADDALIASFLARGGRAVEGDGSYWPIDAWHEFGVMHAFLYDIDLISGNTTPGTKITDPELMTFKRQLLRIMRGASSEYGSKVDSLFADDAWRVLADPESIVAQIALDGVTSLIGSTKTVSVAPHRILICTSVTMHHSHDDFTPAFDAAGVGLTQAAWGARVYGTVMLNSTHPTGEVVAGVRHERPKVTTIDGVPSAPCYCSEMNKEIGSILVTDANSEDQTYVGLASTLHPPWPAWNSLFAYYVSEASEKVTRAVRVVARDAPARRTSRLTRYNDTDGEISLLARQGAFDNIHIAPTMRMPEVSHVEILVDNRLPSVFHDMPTFSSAAIRVPLPTTDRELWKLDRISMAPVCAHDCFHLHWRWSNAVGATDLPAKGWSGGRPYVKNGAPLVPENQNVFIKLPNAYSIDYAAHCGPNNEAGRWNIVNHHGGDYVLSTTRTVDGARAAQDGVALFAHDVPSFFGRDGKRLWAKDYWSVFYWRNRYYVYVVELEDNEPGGDIVGERDGLKVRYDINLRERAEPSLLVDLLKEAEGYSKASGRK